MISGRCYTTHQERLASYLKKMLQRQERLASYLQKMLQRSKKSLLTTQTTGCYYISPNPPQKKMCKSDNSPALAWAPSPKTLYIRRPLPWPRQGRRLGPPEVWNLLFHGHGPPLVQGRSTNNCLSVFMRFTKPQRRQPLRDSSSAGALTSHSSHSILLFRALAICPAWHLIPRARNPSNPTASLSKATLAAARHGHLFLRAFKPAVCRAPNPSNPSASLSKATLAATRHGHLFLRAFKPAVCRAPNPSNPPAGFLKATLAATRHGHLFLRAFKPAVCRAPNPSNPLQAFRRQLSQLHATAICVWRCSSLPFAGLQTLQTLPQAFPRQLSQLHATAIRF